MVVTDVCFKKTLSHNLSQISALVVKRVFAMLVTDLYIERLLSHNLSPDFSAGGAGVGRGGYRPVY